MRRLKMMFGLWNPTQMLFEDDPDGDANDSAADGGGESDAGAKGGGGDDGGKQEPPDGQTFEIKVDGETRTVSIDELTTLAQKAAGADAKFEEASKLRKSAEDALRFQELTNRAGDPNHQLSDAEVTELAGKLGLDPKELADYMADEKEPPQGDGDDGGKQGGGLDMAGFEAAFEKQYGVPLKDVVDTAAYSKQRHITDARKEIRNETDNMVDKDEIIGKMIVGKEKDSRLEVIKEMVAEDVLERIKDGDTYGPELLAASIQKVRTHLKKLGIPGKPDEYPLTMGLGPSGGLPAEVRSEKPIERISAAEDKSGENFVNRWLQRALRDRQQG